MRICLAPLYWPVCGATPRIANTSTSQRKRCGTVVYRQAADGFWWYAEEPKYRWIDGFHTGYNLDSLKCYIERRETKTFPR